MGLLRAANWRETLFASVPTNSSVQDSFKRRVQAGRAVGARSQGARGPGGRAGALSPASRALLPRGLSGSEPGPVPTPHGQGSPAARGRASPALPALPRPATYVMAEGNGSADEGRISKDGKSVRVKASRQPAAIFAIEDQSRLPPQPGTGTGLETAGGDGARPSGPQTSEGRRAGRGADRAGARAGRGAARGRGGGGRTLRRVWLLSAGAAAPPPPSRETLETDLGELSSARALSLSSPSFPLSVSPLIYSPDCRREGGGGGGGGGVAALGRGVGVDGGKGGVAGGETCGRERLRLASPGKSEGGGWGWAAGGLGVRAIGRGRPGAALLTRQKGTLKVGARWLPPPGGGADPAPRAPKGQPAAERASGCRGSNSVLGLRLRGLFLHRQAACPEPFSRAQNPLPSLGIVNK